MCLVSVLCDDMVGDGWNGASLEVWQDSVLRGNVTLTTGYSGEVEVPVCSDDTVRFVWRSGLLDYEISFSILNGDGSVVLADVMAGDLSNGSTVAMLMPSCPSCVHPINLTCHPDSTNAWVSWSPVYDESGWLLYLNGTLLATVGSPSFMLTGLTMNTTYTVGVRSLCNGSSGPDTSDMVETTFRTTCPPIAIPYFNNFSTETLDAIPSCWNPIITFSDAPKVFDEASFSDSMALFFAASGMNVLATPLIPLPGNEIKVTFQAMIEMGISFGGFNLTNSSLRAGVMSNLNDTSSFIPLVTITTMDNTWREYEFSTSALSPDSAYYVAFFFKGDDIFFGNGFVDDLSIMHDNGCERPRYVYVDSVGARSAYLHWSNGGNNTTGYYIYYSTYNNSRTATEYSWTSDTTIVLRGLDQSATYYVWVRSACGEDSSDYKAFPPFTTQMTCAAVSDVRLDNVGYTAAVLSWQYDALNGYPSEGAWVQLVDLESPLTTIYDTFVLGNTLVLTELQPSHSYRAHIRNTCTLENGSDTANSTPFDFMTESCSEIVGDGSLSGNGYFVSTALTHSYAQTLYSHAEMPSIDTIWGIAYRTSTGVQEAITFSLYMANTDMTTFAPNSYVPFASFTPMVTNYTINPSSAEWHIVRFDTPFVYDTLRNLAVAVHNASGRFYLSSTEWYYHPTTGGHTIAWNNFGPISPSAPSSPFGSLVTNYAADVRFIAHCEADECQAPIVSEVVTDSTSVSLAWLTMGTAMGGYVVQYRPASATAYLTAVTTTSPYATISGLSPASTYQVRVGSVCENDTMWDNLTATTGCGRVIVPYAENFDSRPDGVMPPCWNYNRYVVNNRYSGLLWQPSLTRQPAVLPVFNLPLNQLEINFRALLESVQEGEGIVVGVTDDECTTYQWLDTLTDADQSLSHYVWFRYDFSNYTGDGTRIALAHLLNGAEAAVIDDITVTEALGCAPPSTLKAMSTRDAANVVVQWNNPSGAPLWQVAWDTVTYSFSALRNWTTTSDTFYTLPPLASGGKYTLYVRAICGSGESAWRSTNFAAGSLAMPFRLSDTIVGCGIVVYDNGGALHNYENRSSDMLIIHPDDSNHVVRFNGGMVDLCPWGGDTLSVYEGEGIGGALLYSISSTYGPEEINVNLVSEEGPLTIHFVSDGYRTAGGFELYTSCTEAPACRRPRGVEVTVTSPNDADITWTGNAISYDVSYRPTGSNASWRTVNVSDNYTTLSGLTAGATYELFVQGYCSGNVASPASSTIRFTTLCEAYTIAPGYTVEESFEDNQVPARCFTILQADNNPNTMVHSAERAFSGNSSFRFSSYLATPDYNQYLISPYLTSVDSLSLRFRYSDMMYGNEQLRVGYSLTGNNPSDFVWTDTLTTSGILWKRYDGSFPAATRFIAINYMSRLRYYAYVDSLQISVVASADCQAPTITNISESAESITVEFTSPGTIEAYITDQDWNDDVNGVTTNMSRHTFVGLQPNTEYIIGLRSHCTNGINSHWTTRRVTTSTEGCLPPQNFALDEVGYTSATLSWEGTASQWEVNVAGQGYDMSYLAESSPFVVTGLASGEAYHAKIRSLCNGLHGEWSETTIDLTTLYCAPVNQLESHVVDVAAGIVDLSWQGSADRYVLIYGEEHFATDEGTTITDIADHHYRLTGLRSGVAYDFYIKAQCDETASSQWSERGHFVVSHEGIADLQEDMSVSISPNPASGSTALILNGVHGQVEVELIDISGRTVMHKHVECHDGCRVRLDLGTTLPGIYFVRIACNDRPLVRKVVVQ